MNVLNLENLNNALARGEDHLLELAQEIAEKGKCSGCLMPEYVIYHEYQAGNMKHHLMCGGCQKKCDGGKYKHENDAYSFQSCKFQLLCGDCGSLHELDTDLFGKPEGINFYLCESCAIRREAEQHQENHAFEPDLDSGQVLKAFYKHSQPDHSPQYFRAYFPLSEPSEPFNFQFTPAEEVEKKENECLSFKQEAGDHTVTELEEKIELLDKQFGGVHPIYGEMNNSGKTIVVVTRIKRLPGINKKEYPDDRKFSLMAFDKINKKEYVRLDNHHNKPPHWHDNEKQGFFE
ncbi:9664_t:CDS:2 [Gigaspora margarita]|uniref:9664_t:CDS:1 n=1 Tax=Gigaspora margarita TaxID=4874 RepID=A0ABN7W468_GIGMA|nr:9664_t:CDS:2 [Gigaspora margarita]